MLAQAQNGRIVVLLVTPRSILRASLVAIASSARLLPFGVALAAFGTGRP
jgi:hypothetical protein